MNNKFYPKFLSCMAFIAGICACGNTNTAGGVSEESEGIVAINDKTIEGVSQKGPFVTGSNVVLKETSKDGSLTPTGKEFYATTRSDKGDFRIEGISLESQYALFTVSGYYMREYSRKNSDFTIKLNAVSDIEKRETVNINLLTHFEYQRILNLVKSGISFAEAKKQASAEVLAALGFQNINQNPEEIDITSDSENSKTLYAISALIDNNLDLDYRAANEFNDVQVLVDNIAKDIADDGILADSIRNKILINAAKIGISMFTNAPNDIDESITNILHGDIDNCLFYIEFTLQKTAQIVTNYAGLGSCGVAEAGTFAKLNNPIEVPITSDISNMNEYFVDTATFDYAFCTGYNWNLITQKQYEAATGDIPHKTGTMTDSKSGKTYRTTSFTYNEHQYEWMAENLGETHTLEEAQEICPEGWRLPTSQDWKDLISYVGTINALISKDWNPGESKAYHTYRKYLFRDNIDFNGAPSISDDFHVFYLSSTDAQEQANAYAMKEFPDYSPIEGDDFFAIGFSIGYQRSSIYYNKVDGYVRCVKN